jgi:hypothetical protein
MNDAAGIRAPAGVEITGSKSVTFSALDLIWRSDQFVYFMTTFDRTQKPFAGLAVQACRRLVIDRASASMAAPRCRASLAL